MKLSVWTWYLGSIAVIIFQLVWWPNFGTNDMSAFIHFVSVMDEFGLRSGYSIYNLYYPPLASVIMYPLTWLPYQSLSLYWQVVAIKAVLALFYYGAIGAVLGYCIRNRYPASQTAKVLFFTLMNFAFIESTIILSYFDILLALPLAAAFICVHRKWFFFAGVALAITFMIKLLPIVLVPAFVFYTITVRPRSILFDWRALLKLVSGIAVIVLPLLGYFGFHQVQAVFAESNAHGDYLSFAYNLPRIVAFFLASNSTTVLVHDISRATFFCITGLMLVQLVRGSKQVENLLYASIGILFTYFTVFTGVHENHLFPALVLAFMLYLWRPQHTTRWLYYSLTVVVCLNLLPAYALGVDLINGGYIVPWPALSRATQYLLPFYCSAVTVLIYTWFLWIFFHLPPPTERLGLTQSRYDE